MSPETCDRMDLKIPYSSINWMREQPKKFGTLKVKGNNNRKRIY